MVESVNSIKVARMLNCECETMVERVGGPPIDVLVQVCVLEVEEDCPEAFLGVKTPDEAIEVAKYIEDKCRFLKFRGLMTLGDEDDPKEVEHIHQYKLKILDQLKHITTEQDFIVSMGTTKDYEAAMREGPGPDGAVTVCTTFFEPQDYRQIKRSIEKAIEDEKK